MPCLVACATALHLLAVDVDVGEQRRGGHVVVPNRVMDDLVVPLLLAGLQVDAHQAVAVQVVAEAMTAVEVRRRILDRQVDEAEFFVHRDLRPHAGVAVVRPRLLLPRVVAEFAGTRNRVERPQHLAAAHVVGADQALGVVVRLHRQTLAERRADEDDVLGDGGRRVQADFTGLEIDLLSPCRRRRRPSCRRRRQCRSR